MEAAAAFWASAFLGAVTVPIVHFYGRKELGHILGTAKPRVFITAEEFGRMQFQPDLCADIPIVGLVGGSTRGRSPLSREEHQHRYDDLLDAEPMDGTLATDPAGPALIAFTSGTTSNPKGVVHSHQTLGFETRQLLENYPADRGRQLTGTPVGHFIGMLGAFLDSGTRGRTHRSVRRVGSGHGAQADRARRALDRRRTALLRDQRVGPSRLHRRTHDALHDRRPRRLDGPRGGHAAAGRPRHVRLPLLRQQRTPVHHRFVADRAGGEAALHRRQPAARRGDPARTRRRDLQPRPRPVPGLHRSAN